MAEAPGKVDYQRRIRLQLRRPPQVVGISKAVLMPEREPRLAAGRCKTKFIGPEMPSSELPTAAAAVLKDDELENDTSLFIGPPPAVVTETTSANEAECFEEVTRIMEAEGDNPYDVLGVNLNVSTDYMKKKYWKLSLLVHPDKCSHPEAHQSFVKLSWAFKDLQDADKRKVIDEKIKLKEEQEEFKAELKAAQWRRSQGILMPGDDELLESTKLPKKREEWMTTLPAERKSGMTMHATFFSKRGGGDTSVWTEDKERKRSSHGDLVDQYNQSKRSKSLLQKHQEEAAKNRSRKKMKQGMDKEDWEGKHPWKPWDRENDPMSGRQKVNLDSECLIQGLTSRFSVGTVQRCFL